MTWWIKQVVFEIEVSFAYDFREAAHGSGVPSAFTDSFLILKSFYSDYIRCYAQFRYMRYCIPTRSKQHHTLYYLPL